ncbi:MAG: hypothetical protein JWO43_496 [Candidatus Adlerbacteria bacterium]|nr:hypothetical protein [Candidatus Adlerbacteria bacterium]
MERINIITPASTGYELLDSGGEEKLERFGDITLLRPDPQALWNKTQPTDVWQKADGRYERTGKEGTWHTRADFPKDWPIEFGGLQLSIRPTSFKHTGLFPEQVSNWDWIREAIAQRGGAPSVLNLFGYTGGASLAAAQAGASVAHVDASKSAVEWARSNAELSGLADKPIRWIIEDVMQFVGREVKRGNTYDAIIMDPPAFGHGPKNELWKIEEDLLPLIAQCKKLLSGKPLFLLINGYAAGYSPLALAYNLEDLVEKYKGTLEYGDLAIQQSNSERVLPSGIFARWKA